MNFERPCLHILIKRDDENHKSTIWHNGEEIGVDVKMIITREINNENTTNSETHST